MLELLIFPEQKWADVNMHFIMGLPKSEERYDGILIIVDRSNKIIYLIAMNQMISAAETKDVH